MEKRALRPVIARPPPDPARIAALSDFGPLHARLFASRGVTATRQLDYALSNLAPVGSLEHLDSAVELLLAHRDRRIVVVGDFDADGATSTALVLRCLRAFGFPDVEYLVPNRFDFGYGLTPEIVRVAASRSPSLLVTVDNGISSVAGAAEARSLGIAVLVTDHHLPGSELPAADAIVNPNLAGSRFPSRCLAGVGVAFYVMAALGRALEQRGQAGAARVPARWLDLVALGTVADVVPLDHNNRILVQQGLERVRAGRSVPGIRALLRIAGRREESAVSSDLGFAVAPRINAAGRLEDIGVGIECLLTDDALAAERLAAQLDRINGERREIEATMRDQAFRFVELFEARHLPSCVCLYDERWHQGIVGLVAARVRERCHRPVIAFAGEGGGMLKGSVRSVPGVHARDLLESVATQRPGLVAKFGGHAMAAGLSIAAADFDAFAAAASAELERLYPGADFSGAIVTDGRLPAAEMDVAAADALREAGPWGAGFPEPLWHGDFEIVERRIVGERHLKLGVRPAAGGPGIAAIAFNQAEDGARGVVELAYRLDVNEYRGMRKVELVVEQIRPVRARGA